MRNSKKIWKIIICAAILCLVVKGLDIALYPCTFVRNNVHTMTTKKKDVLIFGTSNGMSDLDPDYVLKGTGMTGQNMCVGGEYPVDIYYLTKLALEKQKPKTVIFELSPGYFTTEKEKGNNYLLFYHEYPMSVSKIEYYMDTMLNCDFRSPLFAFHEYSLQFELSKMKDTVYQKVTDNYDVSYLKGTAQEYHENGFVEKYPVNQENFPAYSPTLFTKKDVKETNMEYLDKLIKLCKDNDVEFIATTMPLAATMLVEDKESYKEAWDYFADYFHEKKVPYYNFNREYYDSYGHGLENYVDYDGHMNGDSARQFSEVFGQVVFQK